MDFYGQPVSHPYDLQTVSLWDWIYAPRRQTYELYKVQSEQVASFMEFPNCQGKTPAGGWVPPVFAGLWWIDGSFSCFKGLLSGFVECLT